MPISLDEYKQQFGQDFAPGESYDKPYGWSDRLGASVDSAQAGLLGVGEAAGLDWGGARRRNQYDSEVVRQAAVRDTGAPERIRDIDGFGSLAKGFAGLAVDSAPQLATSIAAGVATGGWGLALPTAGRLAAGAAAGAPFNMGDILQNQRQEAGQTDLLSAAALTVPYTAADMLGLDTTIATGKFARAGMNALDDIKGWKGYAARGATNTSTNALLEGTGETLQEVANQAGRIAVNPNQTLFNPEANERYVESFLGGALLGGGIAAPFSMGRSEGYKPELPASDTAPGTSAADGTTDLLDPSKAKQEDLWSTDEAPLNQYSPLGKTTAFEDGSFEQMMGRKAQLENAIRSSVATKDMKAYMYATQELASLQTKLTPLEDLYRRQQAENSDPAQGQMQLGLAAEPKQPVGLPEVMIAGPSGVFDPRNPGDLQKGPPQTNGLVPADAPQLNTGGNVGATPGDIAAMQDPGTIEAMRRYQQQVAERQAAAEAQAQGAADAQALHNRMGEAGIDPANKPANKFFRDGEAAVAKGAITPEFFQQLLGQVKTGVDPSNLYKEKVATAVKAADKITNDAQKAKDTQAVNTKTAAAEEAAGLIPVGGAAKVQEAIEAGHSGKEALVAQRIAKKDSDKLAAAQSAMAETTPNAVPKPSTAKVVESKPTATTAPVTAPNAGSAPAGAGTTTQPAAAPVAATPGTDAVPAQPAPAAATESKAVKKPRVVATGTLSGKPAEVAKPVDAITDEYEAMKEKRRKRRENAEALAGDKPIPHPDVDVKLHSGGMSSEDLDDALVAAKYHIRNGVRAFSEYTTKMVADFGDAIKPYLRRIFTDAHAEEKSKKAEVALDKDGQPTIAVSKDANGNETKMTVKMVGKDRAAVIEIKDGKYYLAATTSSTGSVKGKDFKMSSTPLAEPVMLGTSRAEVLEALPYAAAEAGVPATKDKKVVSAKKEGAGLDNSGRPDFSKVNAAYSDNPVWNLAIRFYMGVDEFGNPIEEQMAQESAARLAAEQLGQKPLANSQAQVSKALKALGFDADVRKAFWAEQTSVEPMPGLADQAEKLQDEARAAVELYAKRDGIMDETGDGTERGTTTAVEDDSNTEDNLDEGDDEAAARKEYIGAGFNTDRSGNGGVKPNSVASDPYIQKVIEVGVENADTPLLILAGEMSRRFITNDNLTGSETARVTGYARENTALISLIYAEVDKRPMAEIAAGIRATRAFLQAEGEMFASAKDKPKKGKKNETAEQDTGPVADTRERTANPFEAAFDSRPERDGEVGDGGQEGDVAGAEREDEPSGSSREDGSFVVTVNGKAFEIGDGKSAVTSLTNKIDRFKALLDCLKR